MKEHGDKRRKTFDNMKNIELEERLHEMDSPQIRLRWMVRRDIQDLLEIDRDCMDKSWSRTEFVECFSKRNCVGMVAEIDGQIVAYMIYELSKRRIELTRLVVSMRLRRHGIGARLVHKLIGKLSEDGRCRITFPVPERNLAAQLFFRSLGFRAISVLKHYDELTKEDAYVMQYRIATKGSRSVSKQTFHIIH